MKHRLAFSQKITVYLLIFFRIVSAFLILKNPFWGIILCIFLDDIDFGVWVAIGLRIDLPVNDFLLARYHRIDKILDQYYYFFILYFFLVNFSASVSLIAFGLFLFRLIGFVIYLCTSNRKVFLYFPNFFENFCLILLILSHFFQVPTGNVVWLSVFLAVITKLPQEIVVHGSENKIKFLDKVNRTVTYGFIKILRSLKRR